jgi:hypothetical protein
MTDGSLMNKRAKSFPRPLADLVGSAFGEVFARQGFAASELVTHWPEIIGEEIAAYAEPIKLQWPRRDAPDEGEAATLILRVEGPAAIEVQHLSDVILDRVNRFLGWRAVGRLSLRQAPLTRRSKQASRRQVDPAKQAEVAAGLTGIADDDLRMALARLGAAVKEN